MIVTLITKQNMAVLTLPEQAEGQYFLELPGRGRVAGLEGQEGRWLLRTEEGVEALVGDTWQSEAPLPEDGLLPLRWSAGGEEAKLFAEPYDPSRQRCTTYQVSDPCQLSIGRQGDNDLVLHSRYVSGHHACLSRRGGVWRVEDTQSSNGTFVNGARAAAQELRPGDVIHIMGYRLILGQGFLAVNAPGQGVSVGRPGQLRPLSAPIVPPDSPRGGARPPLFYRTPRFAREITREKLRVDPPPMGEKGRETPLALILGPAITLGAAALVMGVSAVAGLAAGDTQPLTGVSTAAMAVSMLCGTALWPLLARRGERRRRQEGEEERQEGYRAYLDHVRETLHALAREQRDILFENAPSPQDCRERALGQGLELWDRQPQDKDFLTLRLGLGDLPLAVDLDLPEAGFAAEEDPLYQDLFHLAQEPHLLRQVPVCCSLLDSGTVGVAGQGEESRAFLEGLLLQLCALHSCDEVKVVLITTPEEYPRWAWARWLPHVWEEGGGFRYVAADTGEYKALSARLEALLAQRLEEPEGEELPLPHYVVVTTSRLAADRCALAGQVRRAPRRAGFSCLCLVDLPRELPRECHQAVELLEGEAYLWDRSHSAGGRVAFAPEQGAGEPEEMALALANVRLDTQAGRFELPGLITFLELYGVGKVEHLNVLRRWQESDPVNSLQAPVGVGTDGEPFVLDLHEKFQGPHGLVAGMTGSGKSEFLVTLILSLAVNYPPDQVAFILIDYKGGGLAGAFEDKERGVRLPHLAGTITNLDGTAVKRALVSIQSELRRRQAIFHQVRQRHQRGTVDIYQYQQMYRAGLVEEPMPHLFIISDEFAELKQQQGEFMDQLVSAARIGRSLGIHLILATQRPSGVVDDQIRSNSRFRVCLKVQERGDSMDVIQRPDAAQLTETGRFYLQVGFQESFAMGQSAWCGAPYVPADRFQPRRRPAVAVLDRLGRVLRERGVEERQDAAPSDITQAMAVVCSLSALARAEGLGARQLWQPAIPAQLPWEGLRDKYRWRPRSGELEALVGEYDDPLHQRQAPLVLALSQKGHAAVYGVQGSGRGKLLHTALFSLCRDYGPEALHIYIADLGEETLTAFRGAPQVGDVLLSRDEEKLANLVKRLNRETARRRRQLADWAGEEAPWGRTAPRILVVIRGYDAFTEQFDTLEQELLPVLRDGNKYGIHFLITASSPGGVRYRAAQNFRQTLALELHDRADYITLLGGTDGVYPGKGKGRGIFREEGTYEFQTASLTRQSLRELVGALEGQGGEKAPPVPVLPDLVDRESLGLTPSCAAFPVGMDPEELEPRTLDLRGSVVTLLLGEGTYALAGPALGMTRMLAAIPGGAVTALDGLSLLPPGEEGWTCVQGSFEEEVHALFQEMVRRNNQYKLALKGGQTPPEYPQAYYVLTGLKEILAALPPERRDELVTLLERAEPHYQIRFLLCGTGKDTAALAGEKWYARHVTGGDGIWAGDGIGEQYALKVGKLAPRMYAPVEAGFGYVVRRGRPRLVKLLGGEEERDG